MNHNIIFVDRNKTVGKNWAFQIICQKKCKNSKNKSHNWKSDNYDDLMENLSGEPGPEENEPITEGRRMRCVFKF